MKYNNETKETTGKSILKFVKNPEPDQEKKDKNDEKKTDLSESQSG